MSTTSSSGTGSSSSRESDVVFPHDFPLDLDVYDQDQFSDYRPTNPPQPDPNDPHRRNFDSLYPLDWLVTDADASGAAPVYPPAPIGRLRTQWQQAFQQNANGDWNHVEYVPSWSDPDWNTRYTYIQDVDDADIDEIARQYAKPGLLQSQRPALRPEDAAFNPTDAAKRWGIYPWQARTGLGRRFALKGWSGMTPREAAFPTVRLDQPRILPDTGAAVDVVTVQDLADERQGLEGSRLQRGLDTTDDDFRQSLRDIALDPTSGASKADQAASLLALLEAVQRIEEAEEYQRLILGGSTSSEVSLYCFAKTLKGHTRWCTKTLC